MVYSCSRGWDSNPRHDGHVIVNLQVRRRTRRQRVYPVCCKVRANAFVISSFHELIQSRGVRRVSVRPSVNFCTNRFFSRANGRIVTKLVHDGLQVSVHPGCAQGQGQGQRLRYTGTFVLARKSLVLAVKLLDRHQTCSRWSPGKRGPNFGFAYLTETVIRRQSAIVPLDTQLASSYSHLQTLFR